MLLADRDVQRSGDLFVSKFYFKWTNFPAAIAEKGCRFSEIELVEF